MVETPEIEPDVPSVCLGFEEIHSLDITEKSADKKPEEQNSAAFQDTSLILILPGFLGFD